MKCRQDRFHRHFILLYLFYSLTFLYGIDRTVLVGRKLGHADAAVEEVAARQFIGVIEEIRMSLVIADPRMVGKAGALVHQHAPVGPGTDR